MSCEHNDELEKLRKENIQLVKDKLALSVERDTAMKRVEALEADYSKVSTALVAANNEAESTAQGYAELAQAVEIVNEENKHFKAIIKRIYESLLTLSFENSKLRIGVKEVLDSFEE